jgi:pimeloyl-ACP methyl ester carboxylesterase
MYPLLAREFRLLAPDTIGHPGRSAQRRISPDDHSFGEWVVDILDELGLERVPCLGTSYGAGILLRTAAYAPERIARAVLVVPSGLVKVRLLPLMTRLAFPMLKYLLHPTPATLAAAVKPLHTAPIDQVIVETTGAIFRGVRLETRLPRPSTRDELLAFTAPALVLAAEKDVFFPARAVIPAAREVIPNLVAEEIIGCGHLPHPEALAFLNRRIRQFLRETPSGVTSGSEQPARGITSISGK